MTIKFNYVTGDQYKQERLDQAFKYNNARYIEQFNKNIKTAISDLNIDGLIQYKNGDSKDNINTPILYYNYGSPAPWLGKLLPDGYGFTNFNPCDIYKDCYVEPNIQSKLLKLYDSGLFTRYNQSALTKLPEILPDNYILVSMQNTGGTVWYRKNFTILAEQIIAWSRESKKNIIFKWHNGCVDHNNPVRWFSELKEHSNYCSIDYTSPLSVLIKNCDMMWTASSMSGIESLICNKPVAVFGQTEYMEMATVCDSPEEAINAVIPKDLDRWLTYYVRKYCINIYATDCVDAIRKRVINYFEKGMSLNELILS
jgi:hypothetical protein